MTDPHPTDDETLSIPQGVTFLHPDIVDQTTAYSCHMEQDAEGFLATMAPDPDGQWIYRPTYLSVVAALRQSEQRMDRVYKDFRDEIQRLKDERDCAIRHLAKSLWDGVGK